jgi:hypothetical protein
MFKKYCIFVAKIYSMEILVIQSKSKSNARLISALARKLGAQVEVNPKQNEDRILTHFASQSVLAKDWLTQEEDEFWKDL